MIRTKFTSLKRIFLGVTILFGILFLPLSALAQDGITLSLTPPFFQLTISPDEVWSSSIKVVNVNGFPLTLYASVVNFDSSGESGRGKFTPLLSQDPEFKRASLAGWIDVTTDPITIGPGESVRVPFTITAPPDASPGGHYAAVLIGTEPVASQEDGPSISVSSLISSLIFARVSGDVKESGEIREFSTEKLFYQEPDVPFSVRFQNDGNVHLLPQGDITIFNMWGKERGKILINQRTEFGNVLPNSIRNYSYQWKGEDSPFEVGRYTAIATLSFGNEARQNVTRTTSFWVVPVVPALSVLGGIALLVLMVSWFIRRYVRRALLGVHVRESGLKTRPKAKVLAQPLIDGVMDLRNVRFDDKKVKKDKKISAFSFVSRYKLFFIFIIFVILASVLISTYFGEVLTVERDFEVEELQKVENYEITNETE